MLRNGHLALIYNDTEKDREGDPDLVSTELTTEVRVLLIGQRLQRRGVGNAAPAVEHAVDGELGDEGLARAGGRGDDHRLSGVDRLDGAKLEVVEGARVARLERRQ